jgi:hypothetical protein
MNIAKISKPDKSRSSAKKTNDLLIGSTKAYSDNKIPKKSNKRFVENKNGFTMLN